MLVSFLAIWTKEKTPRLVASPVVFDAEDGMAVTDFPSETTLPLATTTGVIIEPIEEIDFQLRGCSSMNLGLIKSTAGFEGMATATLIVGGK
jgi:hypothetical protein